MPRPTLSAWRGARRQQISSAEIERSLSWKVLPAGQFDPAELDVVTTEPFGSGPVVELPCSGSVRGTRCVFRRDSIESTSSQYEKELNNMGLAFVKARV